MWRRLLRRSRTLTDEQVVAAAIIIAHGLEREDPDGKATIAELQAAGFDEAQAHRFLELLPMAFSRPVLEHFGVKIGKTVGASPLDGEMVHFRLDRQPEYVAGVALARRHRASGCMPQWVYERITGSSAEVDAISQALNAGSDVKGGALATCLGNPDMVRFLVR
jgi:hypothetical protein